MVFFDWKMIKWQKGHGIWKADLEHTSQICWSVKYQIKQPCGSRCAAGGDGRLETIEGRGAGCRMVRRLFVVVQRCPGISAHVC